MSDLTDRFRAAADACPTTVVWHARRTPAEVFARLGEACEELGIDQWDRYGAGGAVERLEAEVAELFGSPSAVFFLSGVAAQQAALRVHCERRRSLRVALPDLAHPLHHETDGPRLLQGFRFEPLTTGWATATADDLIGLPAAGNLGAVLLELPLREAGCLLPTWEELVALSEAARGLGVPLHVDGARIWESQPHLDHSLAEVAVLVDTLYVSFYKGLGALSGAAVVCDEATAAELRAWRQRLGGTTFSMTPYAVSALVGLRDELPAVGDCVAWARAFAAELVERGLRVQPDPPHTNTFLVFADCQNGGSGDEITERTIAFMEREGVVPCGVWRPAQAPGLAVTEVVAHRPALEHDPSTVARWYAELAGAR